MRLGGFGYLLKDRVLEVQEFLAAADRVARGGSALDPEVVGRLIAPPGANGPLAALSERERPSWAPPAISADGAIIHAVGGIVGQVVQASTLVSAVRVSGVDRGCITVTLRQDGGG